MGKKESISSIDIICRTENAINLFWTLDAKKEITHTEFIYLQSKYVIYSVIIYSGTLMSEH